MRKAVSVSVVTLLLLFFRISNSDASSTVNIISEGNASAKVDIQNNFNSTSSNNSSSNTKVRIETNGEVKEYESSNGEDVNIQSSDGSSKVVIKNNGSSTSTITPKPTLKEDENATNEAKEKVTTLKEKQRDFFEKLGELIRNFFANLF